MLAAQAGETFVLPRTGKEWQRQRAVLSDFMQPARRSASLCCRHKSTLTYILITFAGLAAKSATPLGTAVTVSASAP
jgi:hypothetical protein